MREAFYFDGVSSQEYGIIMTGTEPEAAPQRDVENITVPGRNGGLLRDNGRFENVEVVYHCAITQNFRRRYDALLAHLFSSPSYRRLEDTLHSDFYRMAVFRASIEPTVYPRADIGTFDLRFDCTPQRYLKQGQFPIAVQSGKTIGNQWMPSQPLIRITGMGSGRLVIGNSRVDIADMDGGITLDCDVQNAYDGTLNLNNNITITGGWPVLATGQTAISFSGGITAVEITPRWWTV